MNTRTIGLVGAVTAVLASGSAVFAQPTTTNPYMPSIPPTAYLTLNERNWDYMNLRQASAAGFSDSEVATIAKISDKADVPFTDVMHQVLDGTSFLTLADRYNLSYDYIIDNQDYQNRIRDYRTAYENTGRGAARQMVAAYQEGYLNPSSPLTSTTSSTTTITTSTTLAQPATITAAVATRPELSTFYNALRTAGLDTQLSGPGTYTVYAPTNDAFAKLSPSDLNALLSDQTRLVRVLDYHIVPSSVMASDQMTMTSSPATLSGDPLTFSHSGSSVMVNGASVTQPDIVTGNGVIREVDTLLLPSGVTPLTGALTYPSTSAMPMSTNGQAGTPSTLNSTTPITGTTSPGTSVPGTSSSDNMNGTLNPAAPGSNTAPSASP